MRKIVNSKIFFVFLVTVLTILLAQSVSADDSCRHAGKKTGNSREATCAEEGYIEYQCTKCGERYYKFFEKLSHVGETTGNVNKTSEDGERDVEYKCSLCGGLYYETHYFGDFWLSDRESHWQSCSCGFTTDKENHTWVEGDAAADQTNEELGFKEYVCSVCGARKNDLVMPWIRPTFFYEVFLFVLRLVNFLF